MSVQRYIILTFLAIRQNWLLTNLHCKGKFIDGCLRIEIDDNNCQDNGKDAETNVKKSLDGASTKLFGHTTLETTNVMFVMGHIFIVSIQPLFAISLSPSICWGSGKS